MSFLQLDGTFWLQIINFFIFYAILNVVYIKPAAEALRKRRAYIDSVEAEYEAARRTVQELKAQAGELRAEGRREGDHLAATIRNEAMQRSEEIVAKAQNESMTVIDSALARVETELNSARASRYRLAGELADTMLQRVVGTL